MLIKVVVNQLIILILNQIKKWKKEIQWFIKLGLTNNKEIMINYTSKQSNINEWQNEGNNLKLLIQHFTNKNKLLNKIKNFGKIILVSAAGLIQLIKKINNKLIKN